MRGRAITLAAGWAVTAIVIGPQIAARLNDELLPDVRSFFSDGLAGRADDGPTIVYGVGTSNRASTDCNIKGNISINTGEPIYHLPGQEHYDETIIRSQYGERWFCSEAEARAAGWRKARR